MPGHALGDRATDDRADRDREAADAAPGAEGERATLERHAGRQDRQGQRRHDRAADALEGAGEDQDLDGARARRRPSRP